MNNHSVVEIGLGKKSLQDGEYSPNREKRWREIIDLIVELIVDKSSKQIKILDLGCGDGAVFAFLKNRLLKNNIDIAKIKYTGVDVFNGYESSVKKLGGVFVKKSIFDLKEIFKKSSFDVIIASEIIEHVVDTDKFVNIIKWVLKPSGYLFITTPNLSSWHSRLLLLFGYQPLPTEVSNIRSGFGKGIFGKMYSGGNNQAIHHVRIFTQKALIEFLTYHGLEIKSVSGGGYRRFDDLIFRYFKSLSPVIKVICQKSKSEKKQLL